MRLAFLCFALAAVCSGGIATPALAQPGGAPIFEDVVLRVKMDKDLAVTCEFDSKAKKDQAFKNTEYRVAVLDQNGVKVNGALTFVLPLRDIVVAAGKVTKDGADTTIVKDKLVKGQTYYLVVGVRDLTGLAKFTAP